MHVLQAYTIKFSGLELGLHTFEYQLDKTFFKHFDFSEFEKENLKGKVTLDKKPNRLDLLFEVLGTVEVLCDVSGNPFTMPIQNNIGLIVKFGDELNDSNEEILILPHGEFELNFAQYLYECTVLAVPLKKVDPDLENSKEGRAMLDKLNELSPQSHAESSREENMDPRWDKLKDLLN